MSTLIDREIVEEIICRSNLGIDQGLLQDVIFFLRFNLGQLTPDIQPYEILSAIAIVGQTLFMNDMSNNKVARSGITLQHVMRHIGSLSKERYLDILTRVLSKWRQAPFWLQNKTENLKINYRIYKKYWTVFEELSFEAVLQKTTVYNVMAIFWILFLYMKGQNSEFENTVQLITLLHTIILFIFRQVVSNLSIQKISCYFRRQFPENEIPQQQKYNIIKDKLINKLNNLYLIRHIGGNMKLNELNNIHFTQRYLDDISNYYQRFQIHLPQNTINQLTFLELNKNITPLPKINNDYQEMDQIISEILDLEIDDDDDQRQQSSRQGSPHHQIEDFQIMENQQIIDEKDQNQMKEEEEIIDRPSPFFISQQFEGPTPISIRQINYKWLLQITSRDRNFERQEVRQLFAIYTNGQYNTFKSKILKNITTAIQRFTPQCKSISQKGRQILKFCYFLIMRITNHYVRKDYPIIFGATINFQSIICLAVNIFNYADQALIVPFNQCCQIFDISLFDGFKSIYWFRNLNLPNTIDIYISNLQKKLLIEQIWQTQGAYEFLNKKDEKQELQNGLMIERLEKLANVRTQQLCMVIDINEHQVTKIINLVYFILRKRTILLKRHRIDQIIICAIASCLSSTNHPSSLDIEKIFNSYNQLTFSSYSYKNELYDSQGKQIGLLDFYQLIFQPAIQSIFNDPQHQNVLKAQVKLENINSKNSKINSPINLKHLQTSPRKKHNHGEDEGFLKEQNKNKKPAYISNMSKELFKMDIKENKDKDENDKNDFPTINVVNPNNSSDLDNLEKFDK